MPGSKTLKVYICIFIFTLSFHSYSYELTLVPDLFKSEKFNFSIKKLVDSRLNKEKIVGYTKLGITNKIEEVTLPKGFEKYCNEFFKNCSAKFYSEKTFIAVINQITIQESSDGSTEYSDVSLAIDFYLIDTLKGECSLFYPSFVKSVTESKIDITKKHSKNLSHAFLVSFENLQDHISAELKPFYANVIQISVFEDSLYKANQKFPLDTILKDGIYYSSKQLYQNNPYQYKEAFLRSVDTSRLETIMYEGNRELLGNDCFAFVKSGVLYLCPRKTILHKSKMQFCKKTAVIYDVNTKKSTIRNDSNKSVYFMFGLAGYLIEAAVNALQGQKHKGDLLYVDLENGLISM